MIEDIKDIAFERFDGNFTAALIDCVNCGINMNKIPENVRHAMKSGMIQYKFASDFYMENGRVVIDALQI